MIIDANGAIAGRLASFAAKKALQGEDIFIINSEKAIVSGNKQNIVEKYRRQRQRGGNALKGPNYPRSAERILKRMVRGMLPDFRRGNGRMAFKRIKCYIGVPKEFENQKHIKTGKEKTEPFVELSEVSKLI